MTEVQKLRDSAHELNKLFWEEGIDIEFYYYTNGQTTIFAPEYMPDEERN